MKDSKVDFKIRQNRLLLWLIILLTIFLVIAIGVFVFFSVESKNDLSCLLGCKQQEKNEARVRISSSDAAPISALISEVPWKTEMPTTVVTAHDAFDKNSGSEAINRSRTQPTVTTAVTDRVSRPTKTVRISTPPLGIQKNVQKTGARPRDYIQITGFISFKGNAPRRLHRKSRLIVKFNDVSKMDASSVLLGKTLVDLSDYRKDATLRYIIDCKRPSSPYAGRYSVSAVLNVGWKAARKRWIRRGDYFTETMFDVHIDDQQTTYEKDIELVHYN